MRNIIRETPFVYGIVFMAIFIMSCKLRNHSDIKQDYVTISAIISTRTEKKPKLIIFYDYDGPLYQNQSNYKEVVMNPDNKSFHIIVRPRTKYLYFRCSHFPGALSGQTFLLQRGDSCNVIVLSNSAIIENNDAKLMQFQHEIHSIEIPSGLDFTKEGFTQSFKNKEDSLLKMFDQIALRYKHTISPEILSLLRINFSSALKISYLSIFKFYKPTGKNLNEVTNYLLQLKENTINKPPNEFFIKESYNYAYCTLLINRCIKQFSLNSRKEIFAKTYHNIVYDYNGLLREKTLCAFFMTMSNYSPSYIAYMKKAYTIMNDSSYKSYLAEVINSNMQGEKAFDFTLKSSTGKIYSLSEFKGKTVVCHLWFTGCSGCASLRKAMIPLEKKHKDNKNVIFLNINVDSDSSMWRKGLATGIYTAPHEINLWIGRNGILAPLIRHYNYIGFPQVLLIDGNGYVISANPPRPETPEGLNYINSLIAKY